VKWAVKLTEPNISGKIKYLRPKVSKGRPESPLVGRWGKAPYPKMLRYLLLEMFGFSLTASFFCSSIFLQKKKANRSRFAFLMGLFN